MHSDKSVQKEIAKKLDEFVSDGESDDMDLDDRL